MNPADRLFHMGYWTAKYGTPGLSPGLAANRLRFAEEHGDMNARYFEGLVVGFKERPGTHDEVIGPPAAER